MKVEPQIIPSNLRSTMYGRLEGGLWPVEAIAERKYFTIGKVQVRGQSPPVTHTDREFAAKLHLKILPRDKLT